MNMRTNRMFGQGMRDQHFSVAEGLEVADDCQPGTSVSCRRIPSGSHQILLTASRTAESSTALERPDRGLSLRSVSSFSNRTNQRLTVSMVVMSSTMMLRTVAVAPVAPLSEDGCSKMLL